MHLNYGKCTDCGDPFQAGERLVAKVVEANPDGDSILQFVHTACGARPEVASTAAPARPRRDRTG